MFPPIESALDDPNGLLAMGGDLSRERLIEAYRRGIFPWYEEDQPLLWWSPNPRAVITPKSVHISRRIKKTMRVKQYTVTIDTAFDRVIKGCGKQRKNSHGTWITEDMQAAYIDLFNSGNAHSLEVWFGEELIGGLYGVAIGNGIFCGESMFHTVSDASKIAFIVLCKQLERWNWRLIDCQIMNPHLASLGVVDIPRQTFKDLLEQPTKNDVETYSFKHALDWSNTNEFIESIS